MAEKDKKKKSLARRIIEAEQRNMPMNRADLDRDRILDTKEEIEALKKIRRDKYGDPMKFPKTYLKKLQREDKKQGRISDDFTHVLNKEYSRENPDELMRNRSFNIDPRAFEVGPRHYQEEHEGPYAGRGTLRRNMKKGGKVKSYKKGGKVRGAGIAKRGTRKCKMR